MKGLFRLVFIILFAILCSKLFASSKDSTFNLTKEDIRIEIPSIIVQGIAHTLEIYLLKPSTYSYFEGKEINISFQGQTESAKFKNGKAEVAVVFEEKGNYHIDIDSIHFIKEINPIPLWYSVIPPLLAIIFALIFKEVFSALFIGLFIGTSIISFYQGNNLFMSMLTGLLTIIDTYFLESLTDPDHMSIIVFSLLIGGMVSLISKNGGMRGVVNILSLFAKKPRSGQFVSWLLGIAIFFDDYANTLIVGNTMRPVTDKLRISREKLSYIVDSTAAPVASVALITTWIGAELSYIQLGIENLGLSESPYIVLIHSLKYSFYPFLALIFILLIIWMNRDFGPMLYAERKARKKIHNSAEQHNDEASFKLKDFDHSEGVKTLWYNAVIPILFVILGTFAGLYITGKQNSPPNAEISTIIGNADSFKALLWSSLGAVLIAILLTITQKILTLKESIDSLINGFRTMLTAVVILVLAWSIAMITKNMHTADFIANVLISTEITPYLVPALTFIIAAMISFSTGSSWGTMAILYPLILPSSWLIAQTHGLSYDSSLDIFHNVVSAVLAGSVLGDHCSPISDTTILSSLASSCNHIEHVRTQLPYALVVGLVGVLIGTIPTAYGFPPIFSYLVSIGILIIIVRFYGKKVDIP